MIRWFCGKPLGMSAPAFTGGLIAAGLAFGIPSCGKKGGTPDWSSRDGSSPAAVGTTVRPQTVLRPVSVPEVNCADGPEVLPPVATNSDSRGLRFIAYNVENWLTTDRFVDKKALKSSPKPDSEKHAVIRLLVNHAPDVVGICEIGELKDLAEIQSLLKAAGLDLPHSHYTGGSDPVRHLGLLSRFPITSTAKPSEMDFQLKGRSFAINRGILDVTLQARGKSYRFLGVHLKSKRAIPEADQEEMRIHEARLLRRHVDSILRDDAEARLIVYGDFNDSRPSKTFKTVTGSFNDPGYLTALPVKDSRGHAWTHYWALHDIYSRIDFVAVTRALRPEVDFRASLIIDDPAWQEASDHRPVLALFK